MLFLKRKQYKSILSSLISFSNNSKPLPSEISETKQKTNKQTSKKIKRKPNVEEIRYHVDGQGKLFRTQSRGHL